MKKPVRVALFVAALLCVLAGPVAAQDGSDQRPLQSIAAEGILSDGYWDETGTLDPAEMEALVGEFGLGFAFVYTERSFEVDGEPSQNPAFLLSQAILDLLAAQNGPETVLFVTGDHIGGATNRYPFFNIGQVMANFDRSDPAGSFRQAAIELTDLGDELAPIPEGAAQDNALDASPTQAGGTGIFEGMRLFIILAIVASVLALASVMSSRNKRVRRVVTTADARDSTQDQIEAMSDLILDLDPRVTISEDADLKERFVEASSTYRDVLEQADQAETGHEIADLRISISKARWQLDVIDAELAGRTPPKEPFTRDNTGSAWDSTRGSGNS